MKSLGAGCTICVLIVAAAFGARAQQSQVGQVAFANSGAPAAQAPFLYGLAQLHNFEYDDAARAFRDAQQADPSFAMAFWGEAMTKNHPVWMEQDLGGARRILGRLGSTSPARIAKGGTERERDYLTALETLYGSGDKPARDHAYLEAMTRVHARYPDDVDATAFYGLALLGSAHDGRDAGIYMRAAAAMEEAFAAHPDHPGLAHYLIHAYDDPVHAPLGLRAARRYSSIAPSAPHALHMTSHIFLAAGMWNDVVTANEQATRVAAARAQAAGRSAGGCGHANMWLMYGYLQQGRSDAARGFLNACREQARGAGGLVTRSAEQDPLDPDNIPAGSYIQMWSRYVIDTEAWTDPLSREELPLGNLVGAKLTRAYVRGLTAAHAQDQPAIERSIDELRGLRLALSSGVSRERYVNRAGILESELHALLLLTRGRADEAIAQLRRASADEDAMPAEFGPPFIDKPAGELLGEVLLQINRRDDAARAFRAALTRTPMRGSALRGLERATRN